jgi:hypothetical protein
MVNGGLTVLAATFRYAFCNAISAMDSLTSPDQTLLFIGLVFCLIASFITLFWSMEDQRAKRRVTKR